jgi:decaprenylphospho-beta-D-erythro-pentofuranosid-2-ulose 2-reductase
MAVRPGFVRTKMTAGLDDVPLSTDPDAVAESIERGLRRNAETVWSPAPLRLVMSVLRHLPRAVFRRLEV